MIAATYTALITSIMLAEEIKIWPVPKLFPYSTKTMVNSKVMVSSSIFAIEFFAISLIYFFVFGSNIFELILIIPTIILLYYSSLIGARYFLSDPHRDVSQSNKVFKGKEILIIEGITMGYALSIFGLLLFYDVMLTEGLVWIFEKMGLFLTSVIILGTVLTLVLIIIFSIKKEIKKIDRYLEQME
jgi:ABC-2 type transport system permease protein